MSSLGMETRVYVLRSLPAILQNMAGAKGLCVLWKIERIVKSHELCVLIEIADDMIAHKNLERICNNKFSETHLAPPGPVWLENEIDFESIF